MTHQTPPQKSRGRTMERSRYTKGQRADAPRRHTREYSSTRPTRPTRGSYDTTRTHSSGHGCYSHPLEWPRATTRATSSGAGRRLVHALLSTHHHRSPFAISIERALDGKRRRRGQHLLALRLRRAAQAAPSAAPPLPSWPRASSPPPLRHASRCSSSRAGLRLLPLPPGCSRSTWRPGWLTL